MSSISLRSDRRGATLPLTVIVLALMAVAVAMTYSRVSAERAINADRKAQQGAFAVAQSGLNRYLSTLNGKPAAAGPWPMTTMYNDLPNGTAQVNMQQLRDSTSSLLPAVYVITSRGRYTAARRYNSRIPSAERTVATFALWTPANFDLNGALTSLTAVDKQGNSGALDGNDHCVAAGGNQPPIAGVSLPNGTYTGQTGPINGNPDDAPVGIGTGGPGGTAKDQVSIDWAGIVAGTQLPPNYTYPGWPGPITSPNWAQWPVVKVNGDLILPTSGKGILIVTGDLRINGATPPLQWDGIVLVGGVLDLNGNSAIYGAAITGLNVKLGNTVPNYTIASGTKIIQYDSCNLNRALSHVGSIQRVRNGWTDTWSSY